MASTVNFAQVKLLNSKVKFTVLGFLRRIQPLHVHLNDINNQYITDHIPPLILYTCLAYYRNIGFDITVNKSAELSNNNCTITSMACNTAYGIEIIDPSLNKTLIHRWKIKIDKVTSCNMSIGIADAQGEHISTCFHWQTSSNSYAYGAWGAKIGQTKEQNYGSKYKAGDIVEMVLNVLKNELHFLVNNKSQGIAFKNIFKYDGSKYRLAVYSSGNCGVTIMEYCVVN